MTTILWIIAGWTVLHVIGAGVLAAVDTDERLYQWSRSAPNRLLTGLVLTLWPITLLVYFRKAP